MPTTAPVRVTEENLSKVIERAEKGDKEALRAALDYVENHSPAWVTTHDLAANAERVLLENITGETLQFTRVLFKRQQKALRERLAGPGSGPLEALLAQRIALCQLQVSHADCLFAQHAEQGLKGTEYIQRYQDRAHKRLLSAVKALAQVRKLQIPAVQINVGEKQVNFTR